MERVGTLIDKLKEQFVQDAGADNLLLTVQMLFSELQQNNSTNLGKLAFSEMMPRSFVSDKETQQSSKPKNNLKKAELSGWLFQMDIDVPDPLAQNSSKTHSIEHFEELIPVTQEPLEQKLEQLDLSALKSKKLTPVKEMFELNDMHADKGLAINEQLKTENQELSANFQDKPIVDLKKAIGINDRYLFINELFRGDEIMYERSLKTINNFAILPEAHYWILRELKVKMDWNERSEIAEHFDQLVKRRFA
jgi:hypothetical protein